MAESADAKGAAKANEEEQVVLEQTLFHDKNVWFYQVPASQVSTLSPRADSWDPEHPFLTGSLRVIQKNDDCFIRLYEPLPSASTTAGASTSTPLSLETDSSGQKHLPTLFAQCPVVISQETPTLEIYVQDCADSSRYFMVRVEDETTKRRAFLGIGFPERSSAFNFKAALQDYVKYRLRQMELDVMNLMSELSVSTLPENSSVDGTTGNDAGTNPLDANSGRSSSPGGKGSPRGSPRQQNFKLPAGATIHLNLKSVSPRSGTDGTKSATSKPKTFADGPVNVPLIPPPPTSPNLAPSSLRPAVPAPIPAAPSPQQQQQQPQLASAAVAEDDWGEFEHA